MAQTGPEINEISAALNRVQKRKKRKKNVLVAAVVIAVLVAAAFILSSTPDLIPPITPVPPANTCINGVQDLDEEGIDCGGACATECPESDPPPIFYVDPALILPITTISDIAFLNGNFYLLDELSHRIMMYDSDFNHVKNFGVTMEERPDGGWNYYSGGLGNDKLLNPASIYAANNKLYVLDRAPRIQVFSKDLVYEKTLQFSPEALKNMSTISNTPVLGGMSSIAVAANGNIFVADELSSALALFDPELNLIKAVDPKDPNAPKMPRQISLGKDGKLYVADSFNGRIQVYSPDLEFEKSISNQLSMPFAVATDLAGTMYVMDGGDSKLKVFESSAGEVEEIGGLGSGELQFYNPKVVKFSPNGEIYIVEEGNARIQVLDSSLNFVKSIESIGKTYDVVLTPFFPAIAPNGDIAFSDLINSKVFILDKGYKLKKVLGGRGFGDSQFNTPKGLAFDRSGRLFVSDQGNRRIQVFSPTYLYVKTIRHDLLIRPLGISVSEEDKVFVLDNLLKKVLVFDQQGSLIDEIGPEKGVTRAYGVVAKGGKIYITNTRENYIEIFDSALNHIKTIKGINDKLGQRVKFSKSLAIDAKNRLLFCDHRNRSVVALDLATEEFSKFGIFGSSLQELSILEVAVSKDIIAVTDMENHSVKIFDHEGNKIKEILWDDVL